MATINFSGGGKSFNGGLNPGDIIQLQAANAYTYLYLGQCNGTAANPIVIKTDGLVVSQFESKQMLMLDRKSIEFM
jgi:hypothetical protein